MSEIFRKPVGKCSILVINVQDIICNKIVAYINIRPSIQINVRNASGVPPAFNQDSGLTGYVSKRLIPIISV